MSKWAIVYTEEAESDLRRIYDYIAYNLLEVEIAQNQRDNIMNAIHRLDEMPQRYKLYEKEPWRSKGLRVLPVDNYLVFYLPLKNKKAVAIIRIMYGGSNIDKHLK